jgi:hypothetical protein
MEWLLQVVDEIDDAIGAARHLLGLNVGRGGFLESLRSTLRPRSRPLASRS